MEIPKRVVHERPVLFRPNMTAITSNIVVCAYARVSTEDEEQEESYKRQIEHFTVLIKSHDNWQFGGVYADHGITGTQLLIATHNPNLVINTDAEQVVVAEYRKDSKNGYISYESGSIENPTIRDKICRILEGGKDAFISREKRYNFKK